MDRADHDPQKFFEKLVNVHSKPLYALIRSMVLIHADADDVLQNTFIKAWKGLPGFRNDASHSTWLYRIAVNESLIHLRKKKWMSMFSTAEREPLQNASQSIEGVDPWKSLMLALEILTPRQRSIFGLHYFNETPFRDIAQTLSISEGTAKATYHQAVKKMESFIKHELI